MIEIEQNFDVMKIDNQLSFLMYACSREVIKQYKPFLDAMDLTYTQYIVMMVLWERDEITVKELGDTLYLDSGTLTPLLKKLEAKGLLTRKRSTADERNLIVTITEQGEALKEKALSVPHSMAACINLTREETVTMYRLLYKMLSYVDADYGR